MPCLAVAALAASKAALDSLLLRQLFNCRSNNTCGDDHLSFVFTNNILIHRKAAGERSAAYDSLAVHGILGHTVLQ